MAYVVPQAPAVALPVDGTTDQFPVNRIFCVGRNYADHVREMGNDPTRTLPVFFMKPASAAIPEGRNFPYPGRSEDVHYEFELVIAIGKAGANIPVADALTHIYGYAAALDMTRRDLQAQMAKGGQPWEIAKAFDDSAPCSKIMPAAKIGHPSKGSIWLELNGKRVQNSDIAALIWKVPEIVATISTYFTLAPGDLIFTGTPAGVGPVRRGDVLHGAIENVAELTVRVV